MAVKNLGDDQTVILAEGSELIVERDFVASRERVWQALTTAEQVARWWGRTGTTTEVVELDARPGGRWRFVAQTSDGGRAPFAGEFAVVEPPARLVRTVVFDVPPFNSGPPAVETLTLGESGGTITVRSRTQFPSEQILQGALVDGMPRGAIEQYDRLAALLAEPA